MMNILIIAIVFFISQNVLSFEQIQQTITENRRSLNDETVVDKNDSDDITYVEPNSVIKDAIAESELVRSAQEQGEEFLIAELTKSGIDSSEQNVKKIADTYTRASLPEGSIDSGKEKRDDPEEEAQKDADEKNANILSFTKNVLNEAIDASESSKEQKRISVVKSETSNDLQNPELESSRRMMTYDVLDSKARSGEREELRNVDLVSLLSDILRMNLNPLDIFKVFPQLNTSANRHLVHQFLSKQSLVHYPNQAQLSLSQQTPPFGSNELTNQEFNHFYSYPAKDRFQNAYPIAQPNPPIQWSNINPLPNAENIYPMSTNFLNFKQSAPRDSFYMPSSAPSFDPPSYIRYNSLYQPGINL